MHFVFFAANATHGIPDQSLKDVFQGYCISQKLASVVLALYSS